MKDIDNIDEKELNEIEESNEEKELNEDSESTDKTDLKGIKNIKDSGSPNRKILIATIVLGTLLAGIVVFSILFFSVTLRDTRSLLTSSDYKTYDKYYVMITDNRENDFWKSIYEGAKRKAGETGVYVELMGEGLDENLSKEDLIRIAINSGVDGIIVEGDDDYKTKELLREADEANIPVITVAEDSPDSGRKSYIGVSSYNLGKEYGNQLSHYIAENGTDRYDVMVLMDDTLGDSSQSIIMTSIREAVGNRGLRNIVNVDSMVITNSGDYAAEEEIRDMFVGGKDLPDAVICLSEKNTICVYQTVVDYNKVGEVEIFGYYLSPTIRTALEKDIVRSSIVIDTNQMGQYAVEALNEYSDSGYASEMYLIDMNLATKDNLDSFEGEGGDSFVEEDD